MNSLRSQAFRASRRNHVVFPSPLKSQTRRFHPTKPAQSLNDILDITAGFIHSVHSVSHLPWVASIPLTALTVRTFVGLPLQIYTKSHARREKEMQPILASWTALYLKQMKTGLLSNSAARKRITHKQTTLRGKWGVGPFYRWANISQVPVWIALMESLRGMCGNKNGIVPWLLSIISGADTTVGSEVPLHLKVESTFANEGALWFPDLLAGDSTGVLPAILTASIILNVRNGWKATPRSELADMPKLQMFQASFFSGLRVFIQILAVNVGLSGYFYEMPAALMIYWITSTNIATLQTWFLDKYMFTRPPISAWSERFTAYNSPTTSDPFMKKLL
ncbi:hypothetical protein N7532_010298 [Penicillium argentinense]|uniref:Membrane insertase YidC/Oxa/ALB C-terminal domain-containing protein n=1 Tax=Penicillium argentinense TaxID=1131581 RepID=A0A9W9EPC5_9EURO|nr:uncharacterized protein N7532_010298 [Penicillium argentinense]KAJ5085527.1 hypothetical protein N7532_010298 [Penicillium argentinense]